MVAPITKTQRIHKFKEIMISMEIPGVRTLHLKHLVLDYNGTLASDGSLLPEVEKILGKLHKKITLHIITADTHGNVKKKIMKIPCTLHIIGDKQQDVEKLQYISSLGTETVVAIGNGRNDLLMLEEAALGIGVIQAEGAHGKTLVHADIICTSIISALEMLSTPSRTQATLRN